MDRATKLEFLISICDNLKMKLTEDKLIDMLPENWDGVELRMLLVEKAKKFIWGGNRKRIKEFKIYCSVNNIL